MFVNSKISRTHKKIRILKQCSLACKAFSLHLGHSWESLNPVSCDSDSLPNEMFKLIFIKRKILRTHKWKKIKNSGILFETPMISHYITPLFHEIWKFSPSVDCRICIFVIWVEHTLLWLKVSPRVGSFQKLRIFTRTMCLAVSWIQLTKHNLAQRAAFEYWVQGRIPSTNPVE